MFVRTTPRPPVLRNNNGVPAARMATTSKTPTSVEVHPLVLLSTVDHYNRVEATGKKRVVGVLLGDIEKGKVDVTNSFAGTPSRHSWRPILAPFMLLLCRRQSMASSAVPFEEDESAGNIWYLDHNFMESMFAMFKKVNGASRPASFPRCIDDPLKSRPCSERAHGRLVFDRA